MYERSVQFARRFFEFEEKGIKILGVSTDDEKSHQKFISKYELPFTLLADTNHAVADAYGSYGEKKFMGKTFNGVLRKTFLIDETGKIVKIFNKVKVADHAEVLEAFGEQLYYKRKCRKTECVGRNCLTF